MKATTFLPLSALIAVLAAGCENAGTNTKRGAVGGAAAGAVLGGIIGHQSGNTAAGAAIGAAAGGATGAAIGNRSDRAASAAEVTTADRGYTVAEPPLMPTSQPAETIPAQPSPGAVWIAGHWDYTGNATNPYQWVSGHWEVPPAGTHAWVPGGWQRSGNGYVFVRGQWQ